MASGGVRGKSSSPPTRYRQRQEREDKSIELLAAAATGTFDVEHYSKFKADLDRYLGDDADPFVLSC